MRTPFSLLAVGLAASFLTLSQAMATPVTSADLSGKKFCWNDGGTENYDADGKYSSTNDGVGTWVVTPKGVQISTNQISGLADMQKLADGTFTATWIVDGKPETWTGRYCQ
ncbi:MAG: hypothetical protein ABSC25_23860 [Roseiarcus sp.]|jgi:hypothetical protein